ncbi:MAG: TIM44-like domain-containing protein [Deltaproteobacteria bacterium]|nr:TIM44-like domain-containing protein [Deltaproteobacteria bacterium]
MKRWLPIAGLALLALFALESLAEARPGGGHSYSGGSSGGGGGDGAGALVYLLIRLIIYYPQVGIPVAIVAIVFVYFSKRKNDGLGDWDSGQSIASSVPSADLSDIRHHDPEFSEVLFTDFSYALYAAAHRARHSEAELDKLGPYLSPGTRHNLMGRLPTGVPVISVIVGKMRAVNVKVPLFTRTGEGKAHPLRVTLAFESNITVGQGKEQRTHFVKENWMLIRSATAKSRPPAHTRKFDCPNCGAPFESTDDATCSYCGEVVAGGRFDWAVEGVYLLLDEMRPPSLVGHAPERGTNLETVYHPDFMEGLAKLQADDPTVSHDAIYARLESIFRELNKAWSECNIMASRPFVSDGMNDYLGYWIDAYGRQGLQNITENPVIKAWDLVRVTRDKYYDSIVVRIFAESLDYTIDRESGKVMGGSNKKPRTYSEYWTLIRGSAVRGTPANPKACPNCGGELRINMGGNCEFCDAHITSGEFDWVLSKIEQDEAYTG